MENQFKSSVLLSIFRRKGGEGLYTKLITASNRPDYENLIALPEGEQGEENLIIFFRNDQNWFLLTNIRLVFKTEGDLSVILNRDLTGASIALQKEFKAGVTDKAKFSHLVLSDINQQLYTIKLEPGEPFNGIYQVLHFIASKSSVD